jgi:mono/diheme cytochrome c family protein
MNADPKKISTATTEAEPTAAQTPMPVWPMALMLSLLFLGAWYFDLYGGWFEAKVYAPYRSVPDVQRFQPNTDPNASFIAQGKKYYSVNCAVCHMETGVGSPANGCPPLIDSEWVKHLPPERIVMLVSKGLVGPITVNGKVYNIGAMLPVGDQLPGEESEKAYQVAAIVSYVRKEFGGIAEIVKPEQAAAIRATIKNRVGSAGSYTAEELLKVP